MNASAVLLGLLLSTVAATHDNNVEWNGLSHIDWLDRRPICPVDGETFDVLVQCYTYDLTAVRVRVDDGTVTWVDAHWSHHVGPYDVWVATVPATASDTLSYYIELTDGTETDYLSVTGMSDDVPTDGGWVLDYDTVSHAPIGATLTSQGAAFKVWAPSASSASVRGQFNGWGETTLNSDGNYWWGHASGAQDYQNYKFYFSGTSWQQDARFRTYNPNDNSNSIIRDPLAYEWGDQGFTPPAFEDMVIYELHVGTFSGKNDGTGDRMGRYRDVVDRHLDHLVWLGVNVVQLMPVAEFNGYNSWGYNPTNQWGVEESYAESAPSSPDDLKYMIDRLHEAGIAVVHDVVYNHFSFDGNYMWWYDGGQIYFDDPAVSTPWGSQADFDRWEVQDYIADNPIYWLDEYHMDGIRMDATQYMRNTAMFPGGQPSGWALMQRVNAAIDRRAVHKISIAEELPNTTAITNPSGGGFDAQWHDSFVDNVRQEITDARYGAAGVEVWKIRDAINDSSYPDKAKLVRYVEAHDEAGNEQRLPYTFDSDPLSVWAKGRCKLAQGLAMLAPGIPMFFQGGEWLEETYFDSQYANRLDWNKATSRSAFTLYFHDLIRVRRSNCSMRANAGFNVHHTNDTDNVIAFHRWDLSGNQTLVVASLNNSDLSNYRIGFPSAGTWYEILNSQASAYDGNGVGNGGQVVTEAVAWDGLSNSAVLTIPQMGLLVFRYEDPPGRYPDLDFDGDVDLHDYALLQQQVGVQGCGLDADFNEDARVNAGDVAELVWNLTGPN
ncbi:MAG: alpha amylase C-terminal domain-containing protein [Phycisphaerae bacterium]|nr:alpha amylase C-terminal domain-containing protein [Phycisphaerae bacterium]